MPFIPYYVCNLGLPFLCFLLCHSCLAHTFRTPESVRVDRIYFSNLRGNRKLSLKKLFEETTKNVEIHIHWWNNGPKYTREMNRLDDGKIENYAFYKSAVNLDSEIIDINFLVQYSNLTRRCNLDLNLHPNVTTTLSYTKYYTSRSRANCILLKEFEVTYEPRKEATIVFADNRKYEIGLIQTLKMMIVQYRINYVQLNYQLFFNEARENIDLFLYNDVHYYVNKYFSRHQIFPGTIMALNRVYSADIHTERLAVPNQKGVIDGNQALEDFKRRHRPYQVPKGSPSVHFWILVTNQDASRGNKSTSLLHGYAIIGSLFKKRMGTLLLSTSSFPNGGGLLQFQHMAEIIIHELLHTMGAHHIDVCDRNDVNDHIMAQDLMTLDNFRPMNLITQGEIYESYLRWVKITCMKEEYTSFCTDFHISEPLQNTSSKTNK